MCKTYCLPLQQWLQECASTLRYTHIACPKTAFFRRLKSEIHTNLLKNSVPNSQKYITSRCQIWRPHSGNVEDSFLEEYAGASTCKYRTADTLKKGAVRSSRASVTIQQLTRRHVAAAFTFHMQCSEKWPLFTAKTLWRHTKYLTQLHGKDMLLVNRA